MKLNPPDTAPKDGTIFLAAFTEETILRATVWNRSTKNFEVGVRRQCLTYQGDNYELPLETYYILENFPFDEKYLRGWLPMPRIDDEGNVT